MRVCLIIPGSPFLLDERVFMSLGILKVAAMLESRGLPVRVVDLSGVLDSEAEISRQILRDPAECWGLTATSPQLPAAMTIAATIRRLHPAGRIILGGPHVTLTHTAAKREAKLGAPGRAGRSLQPLLDAFDVLVCGDGELAVFEALKPGAPKVIDADDPKSSLFLTNAVLEETPWPAPSIPPPRSFRSPRLSKPRIAASEVGTSLAAFSKIASYFSARK